MHAGHSITATLHACRHGTASAACDSCTVSNLSTCYSWSPSYLAMKMVSIPSWPEQFLGPGTVDHICSKDLLTGIV